jgi:hypothetical protein
MLKRAAFTIGLELLALWGFLSLTNHIALRDAKAKESARRKTQAEANDIMNTLRDQFETVANGPGENFKPELAINMQKNLLNRIYSLI